MIKTDNRVLVTGGAGYIGSHTIWQLIQQGYQVWVLDNLHSGNISAIHNRAQFVHGDINDAATVKAILQKNQISSVIHFAAHIVVSESLDNPEKYYRNNVIGSLNLIQTSIDCGVRNFVFSSSAAVYGVPEQCPVVETAPTKPISPYGTSKLITEWTLRDFAHAAQGDFNYVALRYFNVAGAHGGGELGQHAPKATHLIKVACQTACGMHERMSIFGDDYATPDGTCVRDYIHVDDLATAHLDALTYLSRGHPSTVLNCGYGHGHSVKEVIECVKRVSGADFTVSVEPRRHGDPPELVADSSMLVDKLGWSPKYNDLELICHSAYAWEKKQHHQ